MTSTDADLPVLRATQARRLHLAAQGLLAKPRAKAREADVLAAIERMRLLQIDTIHVVARSPYLVLFSRLGDYRSEWLDGLLERGAIFEVWAHEACFASSRDHALHRAHLARGGREGHWSYRNALRTQAAHADALAALLVRIREHGAVRAADFESARPRGASAWWGWKDEKRWLEALFALGELMVARRERFQRVYDISERVLARHPPAVPFDGDVARTLVLDAVRALGVTQARWIADMHRTTPRVRDADLAPLVAAGELVRVAVEGWEASGYVHRDHAALLDAARAGRLRATHTTLLSPFDPVVWDRERARTMFGFDYTLECYVPEPKRRFGYFVLPILRRGELVGRLDAKAHRGDGVFEVRRLFLEPGVEPDAALATDIAAAIQAAADWHATPQVTLRRCDPRGFAPLLRTALRGGA